MAYIDNGDGTITTEEGIRIAKPLGMGPSGPPPLTVNPAILEAVQPGDDQRTASYDPIAGVKKWWNEQAEPVVSDIGYRAFHTPEQVAAKKAAELPVPPHSVTLPDQDITTEKDDTVAPGDRVQIGGGPGAGFPSFGPPRVIDKGGMRPVQQSIQKGTAIPEELKQEAEGNILTHRAANEAARLASEEENKQVAGLATSHADEEQARLQRQQERADRHASAMQDATAKLDQMSKEYREKPVNQDTYWEEKGQGAKILSGLYVAMDEIVALKTGRGGGTAATIIDKQINDWISDKRERRRGAIEDQRSLIGQTRANFESEAAQHAALKAQAYDAYRSKLSAVTANSASEKEKAAALALDADLADKALDWKTKAAQLEADHVTVHEKMVGPTVVGGAPKLAPLERSQVVQDLNGRKYLARDVESARDLNQKHALTKVAIDAANTMARISEKSAGEKLDPNSTAAKEFAFAQEQFVNSMNTLAGQGVVRSEDITRYQDYTGGRFGLSTAEAARKLASRAGTAYSYTLNSKADTETQVAEDFQQNPKTGTLEKIPHYQTFSNGRGGQVPIAFSAVGKHGKKKH